MENSNTENQETKEYCLRLLEKSECALLVAKMHSEFEIVYANEYFYKMMQYTEEEFKECFGNKMMGPILPEEKQRVKALMARQAMMGGNLVVECRVSRKDGSVMWVSICAKRDATDPTDVVYLCTCMDVTMLKQHLDDVYKAKKDLDIIANNIPGGVIKLCMTDFRLLYANDGFYRIAGYSRSEYSMRFRNCCEDVIYPEDMEKVRMNAEQSLKNRGPLSFEYRIVNRNGEVRWSYINGTRVEDDNGLPVYLCIIMDITSRKRAEKQIADAVHRANVIATMVGETIWTYDIQSGYLYRAGNLDKTYSSETVLKDQFAEGNLNKIIHPEDEERFVQFLNRFRSKEGEYGETFRVFTQQGVYKEALINVRSEAQESEKPNKAYGITRMRPNIFTEVTTEKKEDVGALKNKLLKMAQRSQAQHQDSITGLLPYAQFLSKAKALLSEQKEGDAQYAIVCADIDDFSKVSHHYGFYISNHMLKVFSDILLKSFPQNGMCTRVDGDYFIVLFQYEDEKQLVEAMSSIVRYQEEMKKQEEDYIEFESTVGVYLVKAEEDDLLQMLERADLARRSIKGLRGNHYAIYTEDMATTESYEDQVINEVKSAMENDTVEIYYLPRIKGSKENIIGAKAIPRILLNTGNYLEYQQIMHLIERGKRIEEFSFYLLRKVAANLGAWKARGNHVLPVSMEMVASQLGTKYAVRNIHEIVVKNNLEPKDIVFEIPERFFADRTTGLEIAIQELRALGYSVIITRFGTDHTAVNSIRNLPISGIKFHGEYFSEHMIDEQDTIVLKKMVEMAEELGLTVTCGGIRTQLQEEYAQKIGCHVYEGEYYYGAVKNVVFEKCFLS